MVRLESSDPRPQAFKCSDDDLNDFFFNDSIKWSNELLCVTYLFFVEDVPVAYFSVSNDSVRNDDFESKSRYRKLIEKLPWVKRKRTKSMPAVKIGRLATDESFSGNGIGTIIIKFIKGWFVEGNKTGCRFIVVDAYNNDRTINFYKKNGFEFLLIDDKEDKTRLMFYDLIQYAGEIG